MSYFSVSNNNFEVYFAWALWKLVCDKSFFFYDEALLRNIMNVMASMVVVVGHKNKYTKM
jgi:hypothetical protein